MTAALPYRPWLTAPLLAGGAVVFGAMIATRPTIAIALAGVGLVTLLAFAAPVAHLLTLIFMTAIVPYGLQNQFGIGGGSGAAGLLFSDLLLMTGLMRAAWVLLHDPPARARLLLTALISLFVAVAGLQLVRAVVLLGHSPSEAGAEFRVLLGFSAAIVAIPLLRDQGQRERLLAGLSVFALVLGLWGLVQWLVDIPFAGDVGVREGVGFTSEGRGQVQGGLYAFAPTCVILLSLLISGAVRGGRRLLVIAGLVTCAASLILTYERTFWVAAIVGAAFVIVRTRGTQRVKAMVATPVALAVFLTVMATVAPTTLGAARERLVSIGQYANDNSLRYRAVETGHVVEEIRKRPLLGSAPGAQIFWGRPWEQVTPESTSYAHNGYLWLVWKLGLPAALLLLALLLATVLRRPPRGNDTYSALVRGCQGAIFVLLLGSATFPSFSALAITPLMGVFAAIAASER